MSRRKYEDRGNWFGWRVLEEDAIAEALGLTQLCNNCGRPVHLESIPADSYNYYRTTQWVHTNRVLKTLCLMGCATYTANPRPKL